MDAILIGTNGSSYSIANGTRDIVVSGIDSFTRENVLYVFNVTQNVLYYAPVYGGTTDLTLITVTGGNTITIDGSYAVMADTDELHIQISTGDLAYDSVIDTNKNTVLNPDYAYRTSSELIAGLTNQAAGDLYFVIPWDTYQPGSFTILGTTGGADTIEYTVWATNKFDADLTTIDETEWADVSTEVLGAASVTIPISTATAVPVQYFLKDKYVAEYLMLKVTITGGTTNTFGAYLKKAY